MGSNINLKTFNHIKEAERENLSIFRELYKERPAPANQAVAQVPEPAPPAREERHEENRNVRRDTEHDRDGILFHEEFRKIIRACESNISEMGSGEVQTWLDAIKSCQDAYQRVFRTYQGDPDYIRFHHTKTPSPDGGPPVYRNYQCKEEMHNWIRALQDRKIELNDERTQSNDKKKRNQRKRRNAEK